MLKKGLKLVLLIALSAALIGCGSNKDRQPDTDGSPKQENADTKSNSGTDTKEEGTADGNTSGTMEGKTDSAAENEGQSQTADMVEAGTVIKVYFSNGDATGFSEENIKLESLLPDEVLKALIGKGAVSADVKLLTFTQSEKDGAKVLDLNFSSELETYMSSLGTTGEYLSIGSICNTYLDAYGCQKVRITVNGESFATGHAEYPGYMEKFN